MAIVVTAIGQSIRIVNHGIRCGNIVCPSRRSVTSFSVPCPQKVFCRSFSSNQIAPPPIPDPGSKFVKPVSGIKRFLGRKLVKFVEDYTNAFENKFPKAIKVYRVFSVGKVLFIPNQQ